MDKIINKIQKKIDAIEKLHDKESLMCEEVKDLLEELRENQVEDDVDEDLSLNANDLADSKDDSPAMKNKKAKARFMLNKLNKAKHNLFLDGPDQSLIFKKIASFFKKNREVKN